MQSCDISYKQNVIFFATLDTCAGTMWFGHHKVLQYVCVCVFGIHVLKIAVDRWFWEVYMVFGSLVVLHVW